MFALMPWTRRNALLPRIDSPLARIPEEFGNFVDRLLANWPAMETPEWLNWWGVTTEETDKELMIGMELPGFEAAEVKVEVAGDRLTVEAVRSEPGAKAEETTERARVRRVLTLPPGIDLAKADAKYRNGILEVHVPRIPEAVGRRIEVKT